jgi:hypothetical protein
MKYNKYKHQEFVKEHKKIIMLLDVLVILIVLMHFGAVGITNVMAVKKVPKEVKIEYREINPVTAKVNGYEIHPESEKIIAKAILSIIFMLVFIGGYSYYRLTMYSMKDLLILTTVVFFGFVFTGLDFFNNLGYLAGMKWRC